MWQDSWVFNSEQCHFVSRMYESNGPIICKLKSKEKIVIADTIYVNKNFFSGNSAYIRIGFVYVNSLKANNFYDAMLMIEKSRNNSENVFWSDSVLLMQ